MKWEDSIRKRKSVPSDAKGLMMYLINNIKRKLNQDDSAEEIIKYLNEVAKRIDEIEDLPWIYKKD
jgi:hypothetical protein|tara:strand:+ start:58 stop:255 length:198 start_codon:yes stop_codon:yes gene_type:complete